MGRSIMAPWTKVILLVALLAAAVMAASNGTAAEPEPEQTPDQIDAWQQKERDERDAETPSASTTASRALDLDKMSAGDATGDKSTNAQNSKKMEAKGLKVKSGPKYTRGKCEYNTNVPQPCEAFPCNDHGFLVDGACYCEEPWMGQSCQIQACMKACNRHGFCNNGTCLCDKTFTGDLCERCSPGKIGYPNCTSPPVGYLPCPKDCSGPSHGTCESGICTCKIGWVGDACDKVPLGKCEKDCNGHGKCNGGTCLCDDLWYGSLCEHPKCTNEADCNNNGLCHAGKCSCKPRFRGHTCSKRNCPTSPSTGKQCYDELHGHCDVDTGKCKCHSGFGLIDCSLHLCPYNCSNHGICNMQQCNCFEDYHGSDCSLKYCPNNCTGHGSCRQENGVCVCDLGWEGRDCSVKHGTDPSKKDSELAEKDRACVTKCSRGCLKECSGDESGELPKGNANNSGDVDKENTCLKDCNKDCKMACYASITGVPEKTATERPLNPDLESDGRWNGQSIDNSDQEADPASAGTSIFGTLFGGSSSSGATSARVAADKNNIARAAADKNNVARAEKAKAAYAVPADGTVFRTSKEAGSPDKRGQRTEGKLATIDSKTKDVEMKAAQKEVAESKLDGSKTTLKAMQYDPATATPAQKVAASQAGYDVKAVIAKPLSAESEKTTAKTATTSMSSTSVKTIAQSKSMAEISKEAAPVASKASLAQSAPMKESDASKAKASSVVTKGNAHDEYGPSASVLGSATPTASGMMSSLFGWKQANTKVQQ